MSTTARGGGDIKGSPAWLGMQCEYTHAKLYASSSSVGAPGEFAEDTHKQSQQRTPTPETVEPQRRKGEREQGGGVGEGKSDVDNIAANIIVSVSRCHGDTATVSRQRRY